MYAISEMSTSVICYVFFALYGVPTTLRYWTVPVDIGRCPDKRTVIQFFWNTPCVRTPGRLNHNGEFKIVLRLSSGYTLLPADVCRLLTINKKLTIQYVNEQPKITDSTIFRRIKLKKKAFHMTDNWHRAFSAVKSEKKKATISRNVR